MKNMYFSAIVKYLRISIIASMLFMVSALTLHAQTTIALNPVADNDIYLGFAGNNYGACDVLFVNGYATKLDHSLLRFDLSSIPTGAIITSATMTLVMTSGSSTSANIGAYRITNSWSEGTGICSGTAMASNWSQRMSGTNWTTAGGDFNATPYATTSVAGTGSYNWNVLALTQFWYANSSTNYGVLLKYVTNNIDIEKKFGSRETTITANRPKLTITYTTIGPGGVSGTSIWLKANVGVTTGATFTWTDQSGNNRNGTQSTAANQPTVATNSINFNPTLTFDGTNDYLSLQNLTGLPIGASQVQQFAVGVILNPTSGNERFLSYGTEAPGRVFFLGKRSLNAMSSVWATDAISTVGEYTNAKPALVEGRYTGSQLVVSSFGVQRAAVTVTSDRTIASGTVGSGPPGAGNYWNGNIPEIILYPTNLTSLQVSQVNSYLAIKYGITLDQTSAQNYIASDGTIYWNGTTNSSYKNNIAGIARDDNSALNQKQSKSVNTGLQVVIGNGNTIATDNISNTNSFSADKSALVWGDNAGSVATWTATGAPTNYNIVARTWKVQETGTVGSVKVQIADNSGTNGLPAEPTSVFLLVDSDGNFSSGATIVAMTLNGTNWEANVDFTNGQFFTFASDQSSIYCDAGSNNTSYEYISRVQVGLIDKSSGVGTGGYSDYTSISTDMTIGTGYSLTVTNGKAYSEDQCRIWVDWNKDGDFLDANETFTASGGPTTYTSTITPPTGATVGTTRLRIRIMYTGTLSSCGNATYGEVEDYSINVIAATSITTGTISPTTYCSGASISVPYTITGTFIAGNVFTAQLSDASGSFAAPVSIGTLYSTAAGTISATIPLGTSTGTAYRIRVVSNTPIVAGANNGSNITINAIPTITGTTPDLRCGTGTVNLEATASAGTINWYAASTGGSSLATGTSYAPSISTTTTYYVDATNNGCTTASRTAITATVTKNYWNGSFNTDWNNALNWCAGIPTVGIPNTLDVIIQTGLVDYPIIFAGDAVGYVKTIVFENNTTLNVRDNSLRVTDYLKLDGKIDLEGESQLLQDQGSILDVTSSGKLEIDQQGTKDLYTYNYWSSPVGVSNTTSNNNSYKLTDNILRNGTVETTPNNITFLTSGYDGSVSGNDISIADYWIWKYANIVSNTYSAWQHIRSIETILAGEGFTMKGVESSGTSFTSTQNYNFYGKPNNGDITLLLDVGNDYLVGNPYPSAIDADEFIKDNISTTDGGSNAVNVINGTLYFWEHFASGSHLLKEYEGGYGTYTLMGGTQAITTDALINTGGSLVSTKGAPQRYIPVCQGFLVSSVLDANLIGTPNDPEMTQPIVGGNIIFKNSQRVFKIESPGSSVFFKNTKSKSKTNSETETDVDVRQKIRLKFDSPKGYHRQLLVGVDNNASNNFDIGYDAPLIEDNIEDMFWVFNNNNFIIQAVNNFNNEQTLPLGVKISKQGLASIKIDALENINGSTHIYLYDKALNLYHNLKDSNYEVYLNIGQYLDRFEITFSKAATLNTKEFESTSLQVYFSNESESIIIHNPEVKNIESAELFNILGQSVYKFEKIGSQTYKEFRINHLHSGSYIINVKTSNNTITKKILIK